MNRKLNEPIRCDGQTLFGFTIKKCDQPAIYHRWNGTHEEYWFCPRHNYFDSIGVSGR